MKRIFVIAALLMCLNMVHAQRIKAYVAGGFTTSQIEGDELKGFKKWGGTGGVGAMITLDRNDQWRLGVEANFAQRGARNVTRNPYNIRLNLNYVDIPVMAYFQDPYGGIIIGAGFSYGRLVQQPHDTLFYGPGFVPDTADMRFNMNDLSFALEARFRVWKGLFMSVRWQRSLMPIKHWGFTENNNYWANDCFNSSIQGRLIWQFGDESKNKHGRRRHHRRF